MGAFLSRPCLGLWALTRVCVAFNVPGPDPGGYVFQPKYLLSFLNIVKVSLDHRMSHTVLIHYNIIVYNLILVITCKYAVYV